MAHESEPTADAPGDGGGMHDAPTRSVGGRREGGAGGSAPLPAGAVFGHYTIESVLGEGGMGVVYRARQERPAREVALKVIRPGLASSQAMRRFELEAEVLGRLQHPGIAQVFEAGATAEGQPFFAMELVRGESLTRYAAHHRLGTRERLELFAKVCEAVQHAHTKGVIHRDLKPVNILVDASGQPKILDFGVARVTQHDVQAVTITTDIGQIIGTVPYMSPEQIEGDPGNLDTRSDVYALGVILYELLIGRMPYDLSKKMIHEAARIIQEDEPTRLSSIDRALRGDIETIALKALEKDKARRYQAASDLGADITRFLRNEPIAARPASHGYQLRKFAKRNKALVGGLVAAFVLLAAGLAGTSYGLVRAEASAALARAEAVRAAAAEAETKRRADELQQVSEFQSNMLSQIDPTSAGVRLTRDVNQRFQEALEKLGLPEADRAQRASAFRQEWLRVNPTNAALELIDEAILKPAVAAIDKEFGDQPVVDAQLRQALADRYLDLGLLEAALPLQTQALQTRRRMLGEKHPETLMSINNMSALLQARGEFDDAESYCREALEKSRRAMGEEDPNTLRALSNMGSLLESQGRFSEAEGYYREALEKRRRILGEEHPDTLTAISNMGVLLRSQGKIVEAESYDREALEKKRRVLGEEHPETLISINNMGFLLQSQGRLSEAEPFIREALEKRRRILGEEHPDTLLSLNSLGSLLQAQQRYEEAEALFLEALQKSRVVLGEVHSQTIDAITNVGALMLAQGKRSEAESYLREAMDKYRLTLGKEHPRALLSVSNVGVLLLETGRPDEAERYLSDALEGRRRVLGEEHPETLNSLSVMGFLLASQGRLDDAERCYREAVDGRRRVLGEGHPSTLTSVSALGEVLTRQDKYQEAVDLLSSAESAVRETFAGSAAPRLAKFLATLSRARANLEFDSERMRLAEANLLEANAIYVETRGPDHKDTLECAQGLIDLYTAWHAAEPGKAYDAKAADWKAKLEQME